MRYICRRCRMWRMRHICRCGVGQVPSHGLPRLRRRLAGHGQRHGCELGRGKVHRTGEIDPRAYEGRAVGLEFFSQRGHAVPQGVSFSTVKLRMRRPALRPVISLWDCTVRRSFVQKAPIVLCIST